jgi:membrane protein
MGAALAFYTLLSLMPLLLVTIAIAGLVFGGRAAQTGVLGQIQLLIGAQRAQIVQTLLAGAQNRADGVAATILGFLTLMFGATGVLCELRDALNTIWGVPTRQMNTLQELVTLVKDRMWSLILVLAIVIGLTASLLLSTWISALGAITFAFPVNPAILRLFNSMFSLVVLAFLFSAIYKVVPQVPIEWPDVILGAAVTSLLVTLGNLLLGVYLGRTSFSSTYGAASSTVVLGVWVYYSSQMFFLGAEFTRAFAEGYGSVPRRHARLIAHPPSPDT